MSANLKRVVSSGRRLACLRWKASEAGDDVTCAAREKTLELGARDSRCLRDQEGIREPMRPEALLARVGQNLPVNGSEAEPQLERFLLGYLGRPVPILEGAVGWERHGIQKAKAIPALLPLPMGLAAESRRVGYSSALSSTRRKARGLVSARTGGSRGCTPALVC